VFFTQLILRELIGFSWQRLCVASDNSRATREAANPVLRAYDANLQCELIAQAGSAWQGNPLLFSAIAFESARALSRIRNPAIDEPKAIIDQKEVEGLSSPGVLEVRAKPRTHSRELIKLDLPTFDRPRKAISGRASPGQSWDRTRLRETRRS